MTEIDNRDPRTDRNGTIVTFYSYKGGTGRSMALANVAWILASNGQRVLVVDWDLEAPGLHRFFAPFLPDNQLLQTKGLIDFVMTFAVEAATPARDSDEAPAAETAAGAPWFEPLANILPYAQPLQYAFPEGGSIDFVPAGRQVPSYAAKVGAFDWGNFYGRMGGGVFLEAVKRRMRKAFDFTLIDSRTGVSDTSGICTVQMPDTLVVCFTANNQSIDGAAGVARSVVPQWKDAASRRRPIRILPVLTRVEESEQTKLLLRQTLARQTFDELLEHTVAIPSDRTRYWGETEIPYKPFYAYEELLAPFVDEPERPNTLLAAMERLASRITGKPTRLKEPPALKSAWRSRPFMEGPRMPRWSTRLFPPRNTTSTSPTTRRTSRLSTSLSRS